MVAERSAQRRPHAGTATAAQLQEATETLTHAQVAEAVVSGPDVDRHREAIGKFEQAGFDHVYVHQVGPDQDGFLTFYKRGDSVARRRPLITSRRPLARRFVTPL
jgi:hypothetical protein